MLFVDAAWMRAMRGARTVLVATQRAGHVAVGIGEAGGQRRAVLDGLGGSLGHERQHRVASVAEERHSSGRPALEWDAIEQRPDERLVDGTEDRADLRVPALEGGERVRHLAPIGPGLAGPRVLLDDRDEVDQARTADEVVHEVPTGTHPYLRGHVEPEVAQSLGRHEPAVGDAAREARALGAEQDAAHDGVDAVGADQDVEFATDTALELRLDAIPMIGQAREPMADVKSLVRDRRDERVE